jgi:hypothetical protein
MTAMSAESATHAGLAQDERVFLTFAGNGPTFRLRATLRAYGLVWSPLDHRWEGPVTPDQARFLTERCGLTPIQSTETSRGPFGIARKGPGAVLTPSRALAVAMASWTRPHNASHTRAEARIAFGGSSDEAEGEARAGGFSLLEITSGLQDDSREADERREARALADQRGRVKAARAVLGVCPGAGETIASDPRKADAFCERFGVTLAQLRKGVASAGGNVSDAVKALGVPCDEISGVWARGAATSAGADRAR